MKQNHLNSDNTHSIDGPMRKWAKLFSDLAILYMYIDQGKGQITPRDQSMIVTKRFATLIIH